jgi:hypothetical protein
LAQEPTVDPNRKDGEKGKDGEKEAVAMTAVSMRSLKKANCGDSKCAAKGNVQ